MTVDQQVLVTRIFDAPREQVFAAFVEPDQVAAWYGPEHFDTPLESVVIEPRVGGRYELTMVERGSGKEHPVRYEIAELVEPELIVLRCGPMPEMGLPDGTLTRIELQDHGGKTRTQMTDGPYPAAVGGAAEAGWTAAFDKLAAVLGA